MYLQEKGNSLEEYLTKSRAVARCFFAASGARNSEFCLWKAIFALSGAKKSKFCLWKAIFALSGAKRIVQTAVPRSVISKYLRWYNVRQK